MNNRVLLMIGLVWLNAPSLRAQQETFDLFRMAQTTGLSMENRAITP
jgi:hypothetical protein